MHEEEGRKREIMEINRKEGNNRKKGNKQKVRK
jgi:hypothetical protein